MPRRLGRVRHELMQTMAEMRAHLFEAEEEQQLNTADAKTLREYVRQRDFLSEKKRQQLRGLDRMMEASMALGLYDGELDGIPRRPVPALTTAQEAWLRGIEDEAFSLENAVKLYAKGSKE